VAEVHHYQVLEDARFSPYQTGYRQQYGLNVSGGSGRVNYFVSTDWENDVGPYALPEFYDGQLNEAGFRVDETTKRPQQLTRVHVRANVSAQIAETATLDLSTGYLTSDRSFTHNDGAGLGLLVSGYLGGARPPGADDGDAGAWGVFDPGQVFHTALRQEARRFTTSGTARWSPLDWLEIRGTLGVDFWSGEDTRHFPRGLFPNIPTGRRNANRTQNIQNTADLGVSGTFELAPGVESRTSVGVQYLRDHISGTFMEGEDIATGSTSMTSAAVITSADETTWETRTLGAYAEETVSLSDRLFLSAGLRRDANSAFGKDHRAAFYPKLSASWLVSEEDWFRVPDWLGELRIRAAWGKSGLQPGPTDALRTLQAVAFTDPVTGASASGVTIDNIGNPELRPESSAEYEAGLDLGLLGGRAGLELTWYDKRTEDALIRRELPPSLGVGRTRWENLGSVKNRGLEASLDLTLVQAPGWSWDVTLSGSLNDNEVLDLGPDVEPIGSDLRFVEGFPAGGYWQRPYSWADADGDGMISVAELQVGDTAVFVNRTLPGRELSLGTSLRILDGITVSGRLDYRGDFVVWNSTEALRCRFLRCAGVMNPDAPLREQARAVAHVQHDSQTAYGYLEDGSFWKLRELALSWELPGDWSSVWGASRTAFTLTGRNLATWTDYSGLDPEVNSDGGSSNFETIDLFTQPPVRYWTARVTVSF
jgi:outer membrane receptor protein involved in Fe transport